MKVKAFCARSFKRTVSLAAGVKPVTSPPVTDATFDPALISDCDFLYLKLHGLAHEGFWYGDDWTTAASMFQIRECNLKGTVVFAANCFLPQSPMLDALFTAGARCVVAGHGQNLGGVIQLLSSDLLGRHFRRALALGIPPRFAIHLAKTSLRLSPPSIGKTDALAFQLFWGPKKGSARPNDLELPNSQLTIRN